MKLFYSIKEVSDLLDEPETTLRFWEDEFPEVIAPKRNDRGVRFYKENDIENIRMVKYFVRECGLTLDGVRKKLKNNKESAAKQAQLVMRLKNIKEELKALAASFADVEKSSE